MVSISRNGSFQANELSEIGPVDGLVCSISPANLGVQTEWPDSVVGTTYLQGTNISDLWTGWGGTKCTVFVTNGNLIMTNNSVGINYAYKSLTAPNGTYTLRIKATILSGSLSSYRIGVNRSASGFSLLGDLGTMVLNISKTVDVSITLPGVETIIGLFILNNGATVGDSLEVDWFYIGTGLYNNLAYDTSGNNNHASVYGATRVLTEIGQGLSGDGVNDSLQVSNFALQYPFSLSAWMKRTTDGVSIYNLTVLNVASASDYAYIGFYTNNKVVFSARSTSPSVFREGLSTNVIPINTWVHVVAVYTNATDRKLYINGLYNAQDTVAVTPATIDTLLMFRLRVVSSLYTAGTIVDPRIYNRALTAAEVLQLYKLKSL